MLLKNWLAGVRRLVSGQRVEPRRRRPFGRVVESLEPRWVLAEDFGDAPDTGGGTGRGNYETLLANGGPQHTIVA